MNLNINTDHISTCMKLWRDSLSGAIPMAPEFQLHMMQERPTILLNYERTASAWLMVLHGAVCGAEDRPGFESLLAEIETFQAWVKAERSALKRLAMQVAMETGLDDLLASDPETASRLSGYFSKQQGKATDRPADES